MLLQVENLVKYFPVKSTGFFKPRDVRARRRRRELTVRRGQTFGIVGETGCGKSTLGRSIARLHDITSGRIIFDGQDISRISQRRMRPLRREIQMIFQDPMGSLNPRRRVGSIIGDPFAIHGIAAGAERKRRVQELMERVGLNPEHFNRFPAEFSGGQRQRIGVARALAFRPKLIICDEPVSALDVSIQAQVINLLADLQAEFGLTYLFIAHDLSVVRHVSDTRRGDVPGQDDRDRAGGRPVHRAPSPVHRRAAVRRSGARPGSVRRAAPDRPGRRRPVADLPAVWLPVPPPLPEGRPGLRGRGAGTGARARRRPAHTAACHLPMAIGENLADFRPTIGAEERVIESSGILDA